MLESNLDDCSGEAFGFAMETLFEAGALDVWYTPAYMKKNRPAYQIHVLCGEEKREELEAVLFSCTTTIGIRRYPVERTALDREEKLVKTRYGAARVKLCHLSGGSRVYPEYESVRAICRENRPGLSGGLPRGSGGRDGRMRAGPGRRAGGQRIKTGQTGNRPAGGKNRQEETGRQAGKPAGQKPAGQTGNRRTDGKPPDRGERRWTRKRNRNG